MRGARPVGKTGLLTEFGNTAFDDVVYLNFEDTPSLNEIFQGSLEPARIIDMLGTLHGKKIVPYHKYPPALNGKIPPHYPFIIHSPQAIPNTILSAHSDH